MKAIEKIKGLLVQDASQAHRWLSVQIAALGFAICWGWSFLPPDLKATLPPWVAQGAAMVGFVSVVIGRLAKQSPPPCDHHDHEHDGPDGDRPC